MKILFLFSKERNRSKILFFTENGKGVYENKVEYAATSSIGTEIFSVIMEAAEKRGTLLISLGSDSGYYILEEPLSTLVLSTMNVLVKPSIKNSVRMMVKFCEGTQFFLLMEEEKFSKLLDRVQVFQTMYKLEGDGK